MDKHRILAIQISLEIFEVVSSLHLVKVKEPNGMPAIFVFPEILEPNEIFLFLFLFQD